MDTSILPSSVAARAKWLVLIAMTGSLSMISRQILLRIIVPFGALAYAFTYTQRQAALAKSDQPS